MANLLTRVPQARPTWRGHHGAHHLPQLSPAEVHSQLDRVVEQLREPFAQVAELLADAAPDIRLHGLPSGPLAEAVVQQPAGTAEPGDKAPD